VVRNEIQSESIEIKDIKYEKINDRIVTMIQIIMRMMMMMITLIIIVMLIIIMLIIIIIIKIVQ
jgi:lipopolysaccharide/colanic/teichoic acid biosynthesis glycosyltransferase